MYTSIILVGHLGRDPEMRRMPDGRAATNFSLATNRTWKNKDTGEKTDETVWWRVSTFGASAEACQQYLTKGKRVLVEARMRPDPETGAPRIWTDKDGNSRTSYEVVAQSVQFMSPKSEESSSSDVKSLPF